MDEKIAEAVIKPKKVQPIGENTIPPHYSQEMSRYEPPLPVKKREQEKVLEKVREMTNGESKGSKSEKQAEGETELSWDHEGLEPYPGPEKPKPQWSPKESKPPEKEVDKRVSPKACPKYNFEDVDEEESDTEDSFELEITPQQLSQVTPGEGVLKLTLSKKKPLKLTTGAQVENQIPHKQQLKLSMTPEKKKGINLLKGQLMLLR